jgi:hypothetical protein
MQNIALKPDLKIDDEKYLYINANSSDPTTRKNVMREQQIDYLLHTNKVAKLDGTTQTIHEFVQENSDRASEIKMREKLKNKQLSKEEIATKKKAQKEVDSMIQDFLNCSDDSFECEDTEPTTVTSECPKVIPLLTYQFTFLTELQKFVHLDYKTFRCKFVKLFSELINNILCTKQPITPVLTQFFNNRDDANWIEIYKQPLVSMVRKYYSDFEGVKFSENFDINTVKNCLPTIDMYFILLARNEQVVKFLFTYNRNFATSNQLLLQQQMLCIGDHA